MIKTITFDDTQWQLVPKDITDEMREAHGVAYAKGAKRLMSYQKIAGDCYRAMLAAAPTPPVAQVDERACSEALSLLVREIESRHYGRMPKEVEDAMNQARASLASQPAQVGEDKRDAERYRWLRHGDNDEFVMFTFDGPGFRKFDARFDPCWLPRNEKLDAAIDAAMSANKPEGT